MSTLFVEPKLKARLHPYATISVLDFDGNMLQERTPVGVSVNKKTIQSLGLSSIARFEPEGMNIHMGVMYLGFSGDFDKSTGGKKHACIIKLK